MLSFSVAVSPTYGIGYKNVLPWHIKEELQQFRKNTLNKNIIMGDTTYLNLPGKLKDRHIFVATLNPDFHDEDVVVIKDLIAFCKEHQNDEEEYVICGGASIYRLTYPYCKRAYVSFIKKEYEVDTYFNNFDLNDFKILVEEDHDEFIYRYLERK